MAIEIGEELDEKYVVVRRLGGGGLVIPPFLRGLACRIHAAIFNFMRPDLSNRRCVRIEVGHAYQANYSS